MDRRTALKTIGVLTICMGGSPVYASNKEDGTVFFTSSFVLNGDEIKTVIIERKGKPDLVIQFSEIIDALERG